MEFRPHFCLIMITVILAVSCRPDKAALIPGVWKGKGEDTFTLKADNTYTRPITGTTTEAGTWRIDKGDLVITPVTLGGKSISDIKAKYFARHQDKAPSAKVQMFLDDLSKPEMLTLSDDGRTATTDKSRDTNNHAPVVLHKQ